MKTKTFMSVNICKTGLWKMGGKKIIRENETKLLHRATVAAIQSHSIHIESEIMVNEEKKSLFSALLPLLLLLVVDCNMYKTTMHRCMHSMDLYFVSHDILCYFIFFTIWFWILCICAAGCHQYSYCILSLCATLCLLMNIANLQHFMCIGQLNANCEYKSINVKITFASSFYFLHRRERAKMWEKVRFVT